MKDFTRRAKQIYRDKFQEEYDKLYPGKYVAIDIESEEAYIGDTELDAFETAKNAAPDRLFQLFKIGDPDAFRMRYSPGNNNDWLF